MPSQGMSIGRSTSQIDLMEEISSFIAGTTKHSRCNILDLNRTALCLLKSLPATREAIFEYFCTVFDNASQNYITRLETEIATGNIPPPNEYDEAIVSEIHSVLCTFVKCNAEAWAPIISTWSLELLGEISTRYAGRAHISSGLNETLQLWMNCRATRTLIDITTQCLNCLINSDTEACINALLDTSVKHSPNFDWVVAHVGSCFPNTVITRVLTCGLKDFCQNKSYEQGCESPKLKSVVGILGHLAGSHSADIQMALLYLFNWSLQQNIPDSDSMRLHKKATVPFLLQLAFLSSTLLSSICRDIRNIVSSKVVIQLNNFTDDWCKYFGSSEALEDLIVSLILKCEKGGSQIINLILHCINSEDFTGIDQVTRTTIKEKAQEILEYVLYEVDCLTRHQKPVGILNSCMHELSEIHKLLLDKSRVVSQTAARIVVYLGHNNPSVLINSALYLFQNATTPEQLALLVKILTNELVDKNSSPYNEKGAHFGIVLEQVLSKNLENHFQHKEDPGFKQMWHNLFTLLRWEMLGTAPLKSEIISHAIEKNLTSLTTIFKNATSHIHIVAEILETVTVPPNKLSSYTPPVQVTINLIQAIVNYFFICCKEQDDVLRKKGFERVQKILRSPCLHEKVARVLALRELLERALFRSDCILFGAPKPLDRTHQGNETSLLKQNKKINKTIPLTKHSSVFNGGIVGFGKRKANLSPGLPDEVIAVNTAELIKTVKACCATPVSLQDKSVSEISLDSITLVSLLLVQFVSPDVMYNGLPWPEEEFSKVTIERDLAIRRMFNNSPVLWELLHLVGVYRPALCYSSVLIRALTATLMHQWNSMGDQSKSSGTDSYKSLMNTTIKVLDVMALGQLLPPPLSGIRDVLPHLKSFEIVSILRDCIWCYMRDHVPSPALFGVDSSGLHWRDPVTSRPPEIYTNTLRIIMQRNIRNVGHLYNQLFVNIPSNE